MTITPAEEAVARAILKARFYDPEPEMYGNNIETFFAEIDPDHVESAHVEARAAIRAHLEVIREFPVDIAKQVAFKCDFHWSEDAQRAHTAIIDHMLSEVKS